MPILANVLVVGQANNSRSHGSRSQLVENERDAAAGRRSDPAWTQIPRHRAGIARENAGNGLDRGEKATIRSERADLRSLRCPLDFPTVEDIRAQQTLTIAQPALKRLLDKTHFSMAQQDVRYYLNGMLLESDGKSLRTVATDGHRLAF